MYTRKSRIIPPFVSSNEIVSLASLSIDCYLFIMVSHRFIVSALVLLAQSASAQKYVFAHVVVGNTAAHTQSTWENDITLAQAAGIDAFALNCGYPDSNIPTQVANAFAAAEALGSNFKLFFSFDYLGGGETWPATGGNSVASYLNQYISTLAYFKYQGVPFVSTFEGTGNIGDWAQGGSIRLAVGNIYFVPDWTSLGPSGISAYLDNIEGFFSWDMWPEGATNKTDSSDLAWQGATPGKSYMMGVSPWFFHSGSGDPDWVWRGDDLWADRWAQTLDVNPDFVEYVIRPFR
jgi:glucan endo-1,3-alpha-glucosidase